MSRLPTKIYFCGKWLVGIMSGKFTRRNDNLLSSLCRISISMWVRPRRGCLGR